MKYNNKESRCFYHISEIQFVLRLRFVFSALKFNSHQNVIRTSGSWQFWFYCLYHINTLIFLRFYQMCVVRKGGPWHMPYMPLWFYWRPPPLHTPAEVQGKPKLFHFLMNLQPNSLQKIPLTFNRPKWIEYFRNRL